VARRATIAAVQAMEVHTRERKALGLDPGSKRMGVAASDDLGLLAFGRGVIALSGGRKDFERVREWVEREGAQVVVVGLPLSLDGSEGPAARAALAFAERLRGFVSCPVVSWDERYTSVDAEMGMREAGTRREKRRQRIDQEAARFMLQAWLDAERARRERDEQAREEPTG